MRSAAPREVGRVTRFGGDFIAGVDDAAYEQELIVPWNTVVVLPDVPLGGPAEALAGIAQCSWKSAHGDRLRPDPDHERGDKAGA